MTKRSKSERGEASRFVGYSKLEREEAEKEREAEIAKKRLRTHSHLTRREKESLWENSSKYEDWVQNFVELVEFLRKKGVHSAKDMEPHFIERKFCTLGGLPINRRFIALLREKYRKEGKMHRPPNWQAQPKNPLEKQSENHKSHFMYRPIPSPNEDTD